MLFTIEDVSKLSVSRLKLNARTFVMLCRKSVTEQVLNKYLIENYKIPLVAACLKIIMNATYSFNNNTNELVITLNNKKLDKLASIITFGTGKVQGSNILRYAFRKD